MTAAFNWIRATIHSPAGPLIAVIECDYDQRAFRIKELHGDAPKIGDSVWLFLTPPRPDNLGITASVTGIDGDHFRFWSPDDEE